MPAAEFATPEILNRERNPLGRTVRLLTWMAEHDARDFGVRELAAAVGMAPSTTHRSLGALEEEGLVASDPKSGRYRLSLGFYRLALRGARRAPLVELATPLLQEAARAGEETCQLAVYGSLEQAVLFLSESLPNRRLRAHSRLYQWLPLTSTAAGLAVLSLLDPQALVAAFSESSSPPSGSDLAETLERVRERGYANFGGPREEGCVELAAPFRGLDGRPGGALGFAVPETRFTARLEQALGRLLVVQAGQLEHRLGDPGGRAG